MSLEENKALALRYWEEVWNQGNLAALEELFSSEAVVERQRAFVSKTLAAFSDSRVTVTEVIAEGDKVVVRYEWRAVHTGVYDVVLSGVSMNVPPTGKAVWDRGIQINYIAGGKIADNVAEWTKLELAQQIGALPGAG
jgi:predicted ester cyclase